MAISNVYSVTLYGQCHDEVYTNVFHYRDMLDSVSPNLPRPVLLFNAFLAVMLPRIRALMSSEAKIWSIHTRAHRASLPKVFGYDGYLVDSVGLITTQGALPGDVAMLLKYNSNQFPRKIYNRVFLRGGPENLFASGVLNSAAYGGELTNLRNQAQLIISTGTSPNWSGRWEPVVVRRRAISPSVFEFFAEKVNTCSFKQLPARQRRGYTSRSGAFLLPVFGTASTAGFGADAFDDEYITTDPLTFPPPDIEP